MCKAIIYLFSFCCFLQACSVFEEPDEFTLVNIGTDYIIELSQTLELGSNALLFNIKSTQMDNCVESHIDLESNIVEDQLQLILGDIITPDPCLRIPNQLESSAQFTLSTRNYGINISLKDVVQNFGIVTVSQESFTIDLETENGILIGKQKMNIIPDDYVWGRIGILNIENLSRLQDLKTQLLNLNQPHDLKDGNYSYFEIWSGIVTLPDTKDNVAVEEQFIFKQTSDFELINNSLVQFAELYPDAKIQVINSTGQSYNN